MCPETHENAPRIDKRHELNGRIREALLEVLLGLLRLSITFLIRKTS